MIEADKHCLYLLPHPISEADWNWSIPLLVKEQIISIQHFIVENAKTSRRYLKLLHPQINWSEIEILELDKHRNESLELYKAFLQAHARVGLMSEAGLPCIADPGHAIVRMAHELEIRVKPLVGPSSILLALISSGLNGQEFKFNGYLPSKPQERKKAIVDLEKEARSSSQWFIETPYRNQVMFQELLTVLSPTTRIALALDIGGDSEFIRCKTVADWKRNPIDLGKVPCMFGIGM